MSLFAVDCRGNCLKQGILVQGFGVADEQIGPWVHGIVKAPDKGISGGLIKIDHDIAAENDIEFETDYGDYDFEVAVADGRIVGADYEVDEEYLDALGGDAISLEDAQVLVSGKVPGSDAGDVRVWEENEDGRGRFEGELYFDGMKYEFEIDPATGRIFDWNADLRD